MQPFDALTMTAVIAESKPLILNRRVEKIVQTARDEVLLSLRSKAGTINLLVSAHASFGRICIIAAPPPTRSSSPPPFSQILRRHLSSAVLSGFEQMPGERIVDITFSCLDEIGNRVKKILTAEIMGRHSNLILWDKESKKIIGASHNVTQEMSRQREVAPGLLYARPPGQEKPSIFSIVNEDWQAAFAMLKNDFAAKAGAGSRAEEKARTFEQWLVHSFSGLGRNLAEEIVEASGVRSEISDESLSASNCEAIWNRVDSIQKTKEYKASMRSDLTRFTVLSWWRERASAESEWKSFPSVNDMIEAYFQAVQLRAEMQQLKDRIRSELKSEHDRLQQRLSAAESLMESSTNHERFKKYGDLILANSGKISSGQSALVCSDLFSEDAATISVELNPNLSPSQNAQHYYRLFAKSRSRAQAAESSCNDAREKLAETSHYSRLLEEADSMPALQMLKEKVLYRGQKTEPARRTKAKEPRTEHRTGHQRLMSTRSSDGFTILVGRNKQENDLLVSKLAHPHDIWMHAQGLEGAHVLVKLPNKKDPPLSTLREAAQIAARFARAGLGGRVMVAYTYGKYVRKIGKDKPGLVRYENEKTLEVDTSAPMPDSLRRLFP